MKYIKLIATVDLENTLSKNKIYETIADTQCNMVKIQADNGEYRFLPSSYFRILE